MARYYLDLLKFLDITTKDYKFDLFLPEQDAKKGKTMMEREGLQKNDLLIGVCPGSGDSWGKSAQFKHWPAGYFLELCERLAKNLKAKIILLGSKSESALCEHITDRINTEVINLCGKISLKEFCAVTANLRLLITNDGGPFHIAQALGVNGLAFFGPVDEKTYGTYPENDNFITLAKKLDCRPCYRRFKIKDCAIDKKCLRDISVDEAFEAVKKLI